MSALIVELLWPQVLWHQDITIPKSSLNTVAMLRQICYNLCEKNYRFHERARCYLRITRTVEMVPQKHLSTHNTVV